MQYSIVHYSKIDKVLFRLEAEFYTSNSLLDINCFTGGEIIALGQYNSIYGLNSNEKGYPVLRMSEFNGIFTGEAKQYSEKFSKDDFALYSLNKGDILICRTNGNPKLVGKSALVAKNYPYVYESHLFKIRPDTNLICSETLAVYLNTSHGKLEIEKFSMQGNQANFSLAKFKEIKIPKFSEKLNHFITRIVNLSFSTLTQSEYRYQQAQTILLSELGLTDWQPRHQLTFVKNYADIKQAERIDAEYYQPKYEEIIKAIQNYAGGWASLGNLVAIKDKNYSPKEEQQYKYIELANIGGNGEIIGCSTECGTDLPSRARRKVKEQDVIVSSIEGSLSSIALVEKEYNNALCSTGFYVVKPTGFNSEALLVLLKSIVGQMQLKKGCNGTILTAINKKEFSKIIIPKITEAKQTQIQQKVTESFNLRKQSKHLLECAKRAVEIAIEQDEQTAIDWLQNETGEIPA